METANFGIATSPWQLLSKSGTVAAMLEHDLPVIANRDDWHLRGEEDLASQSDDLLHQCDHGLEQKLVATLPKRPARERSPVIARQFLDDLKQGEHPPA